MKVGCNMALAPSSWYTSIVRLTDGDDIDGYWKTS